MKKGLVCLLSIIFMITIQAKGIMLSEAYPKDNKDKSNIKMLLDEDDIMWKKDSDNDGLPDALEKILGTNINRKDSDGDGINDKLEIELELDPNKRYSNSNEVCDEDEDFDNDGVTNIEEIKLFRNPKIDDNFISNLYSRGKCIDITGKLLLESCSLAWENIDYDIVGKSVKEIFPDKFENLHEFTVIRHTQTKGFSAIAIKNCDNVIVAYQASKTYRDWLGNFLTQFMPHPQRGAAIEFIQPIINKNDKIYITGHSLGGLLAQYSTYYLKNENYDKIKTITFNSANNMNPKHIQGEYGPPILKYDLFEDYISAYDYLFSKITKKEKYTNNYLSGFFNKCISYDGFIDLYNKKWKSRNLKENYTDIIDNYIVDKDPLYLIINGEYLGNKKIKSSKYCIEDVERDKNEMSNAHKLDNFIDESELDKVINID